MYGGVASKIIHRNSTIPASAGETFTTGVDRQTNVLIHVVQGERELAKDCRSLARFDLKGIDPMPAGFARIEVRFLIDANGILSVTARDARTGKEQTVEVKPSYGLTDEQVEAMIEASIDNAEADYTAAQLSGIRIEADGIMAATEKAMRNKAWLTLTDEDRAEVTAAMNRLKVVYGINDHHLIHAQIDILNQATHKLAENMMNTAVQGALQGTKVE
jgi:molecular chaperone DnaK (HSP70)